MSIERAIALQEEAWALQAEGKLEEALTACQEALRLAEDSEGPTSPDVANLLNDLAEIENGRQNFRGALALAERARAIEDGWGDRFTGEIAARIRGKTLELVGLLCCKLGVYGPADEALNAALAIAAAEFGEASEEAAGAQNQLGLLYKYCGRFEEGLWLYRQALRSIRALHGEESVASGVLLHNIGGILHSRGNHSAAEGPARKAWEISRRLLGEKDPRTMLDAAAYAGILDGLGKYEESELIYRQALAIFERTFGPQHYEIAANLHNLAAVRAARGHIDEAETLYRRALALKEKLLGSEGPDAALTRNNLGRLLHDAGRPREAVTLLRSAVATLEKHLPPGHPQLVLAHENLKRATGSL
jgi:tetratricopeptide (TPR) repeat protein